MRISKATKEKTEQTILAAAERLFTTTGYRETTTRQIASEAGIATGTLFNYFATKESLAMSLLAEAFRQGREDYQQRRCGDEDLIEEFFLLISSEIRRLRPYRTFVGPVLESSMSLFAGTDSSPVGEIVRNGHLDLVQNIVQTHSYSRIPDYIATTLYWSLYLGILAFWSNDDSRNQEETLALIDYSLKIFTSTISGAPA